MSNLAIILSTSPCMDYPHWYNSAARHPPGRRAANENNMRLVCPECGETYAVAKGLIPDEGRDVQCASCNHTWFQKPIVESQTPEPPANLSDLVQPAAKSEEEDRERLRRAVREELALQETDATGGKPGGPSRLTQPPKPAPVEPDEADFMDSLRSHLKEAEKEAKADKSAAPAKSSRRNVAEAAAMAGVDTSTPTKAEVSGGVRRIGEKYDIEELKSDPVFENKRRGRRRLGFMTACVAAGLATLAYINADSITARYPQTAPAMAQFTGIVDMSRVQIEAVADKARAQIGSVSQTEE